MKKMKKMMRKTAHQLEQGNLRRRKKLSLNSFNRVTQDIFHIQMN